MRCICPPLSSRETRQSAHHVPKEEPLRSIGWRDVPKAFYGRGNERGGKRGPLEGVFGTTDAVPTRSRSWRVRCVLDRGTITTRPVHMSWDFSFFFRGGRRAREWAVFCSPFHPSLWGTKSPPHLLPESHHPRSVLEISCERKESNHDQCVPSVSFHSYRSIVFRVVETFLEPSRYTNPTTATNIWQETRASWILNG